MGGFEGDDLIATATKTLAAGTRAGWLKGEYILHWECAEAPLRKPNILIASADKDLLALVSDRVEVHSTRTGRPHRAGRGQEKARR